MENLYYQPVLEHRWESRIEAAKQLINSLAYIIVLVVITVLLRQPAIRIESLPPGPPEDWLFRHTRKIPSENVAETYAAWSEELGWCLFACLG